MDTKSKISEKIKYGKFNVFNRIINQETLEEEIIIQDDNGNISKIKIKNGKVKDEEVSL